MFGLGRAVVAMPDQLAPVLEALRMEEAFRVVLERVPGQEHAVGAGLLDAAPQLKAAAAGGALEDGDGLGKAGLELRFHAGLHIDACDLKDHGRSSICSG